MSARKLSHWMTAAMDFVALITLFSTSEVHLFVLYGVLFLLILSGLMKFDFLKKFQLGRWFFIFLIFCILGACSYLWLKIGYSLIVAIANCTPLLHGFLWLLPENSKLGRS